MSRHEPRTRLLDRPKAVMQADAAVVRAEECAPWRSRFRATGRTPLAAVVVVALVHGVLWSVLTPPYQGPDEPAHIAYVQYVAETGHLPPAVGRPAHSDEETATLAALGTNAIIGRPLVKPPSSASQARTARAAVDAATRLSRSNGGGPSSASSQPPLYYALAAVPYRLGGGGALSTRIWLIRLVGALCLAGTAFAAALIVRELMPSWRWAPVVGGLVVALQPTLAFVSASVNPDALLFVISAWAILVATRMLRSGLGQGRALALGALIGAGVITKVTFAALVPGLALAGMIALWSARHAKPRRNSLRLVAIALGAALVLPLLFVAWTVIDGRGLFPAGAGVATLPNEAQSPASLRTFLSYAWQLWLPRPPFLVDQFGFWPPYSRWLVGLVGQLGWLDVSLPTWIYTTAAWIFCVSLVLLAIALVQRHRVWRFRRELVFFGALVLTLAITIAAAGYSYRRQTGQFFEQARYLFPLVALYAAGVAAACTAPGRRWAPVLAALFVGLACLNVLAAVLATVGRYYG
jgi:4-amino-4-deoxy-L-arabinose transferase-like glycosyltransferase